MSHPRVPILLPPFAERVHFTDPWGLSVVSSADEICKRVKHAMPDLQDNDEESTPL